MIIKNLYGVYYYPTPDMTDLPILVVMHGWSENSKNIPTSDLIRLCALGFFVIAPGMRGRDNADGSRDASGREICDIYDAINYVRAGWPNVVSADKVAIVGYSAGGGNALAVACKFPDLFNVVVSYFGMSDYGRDATDGWYFNNPGTFATAIATAIGGTPAEVPNNYSARDATAAITNYTGGYVYLYHDKQDTYVPWVHSNRIKGVLDAAEMTNYSASFSDTGDEIRFEHGYPATSPDLITAEATWSAQIVNQAVWTIPESGTVTVIGYIITKRFTIWLNSGLDAAATVVYNTATDTYTVTPLTIGDVTVVITQGTKTATATISAETEMVVL